MVGAFTRSILHKKKNFLKPHFKRNYHIYIYILFSPFKMLPFAGFFFLHLEYSDFTIYSTLRQCLTCFQIIHITIFSECAVFFLMAFGSSITLVHQMESLCLPLHALCHILANSCNNSNFFVSFLFY